jgi:hypothetical protein
MLAVLIAGVKGGDCASTDELSSFARLLDGERGAVTDDFGLCCVVKSSLMVLPVCLRFRSVGFEDIGGVTLRSRMEDWELVVDCLG